MSVICIVMMVTVCRCLFAVIHQLLAVSSTSVGTVHKNYDTVLSCFDVERQMCVMKFSAVQLKYTVIHNYGNPHEKWNIFIARPHLWLQLGVVKPGIMLCETVLNLSTLNTLTYLRILTAWDEMDQPHY